MEWFLFALLAPILWAVGNITDKIMFNRYIKNPYSYQVIVQISNILPLAFFFFFIKISVDTFSFIAMVYGGIQTISFILFNKALMREEVSRTMALFYINPIFILLLASIFLNESLSITKYLGIILLVSSALLVSYKKVGRKMKFSLYVVGLMLILCFIWASSQVFSKWVFNFTSYLSFLFWSYVGGIITGFLFLVFKNLRKNFVADIKRMEKTGWGIKFFGASVSFIAMISFYLAISIGFVSLVGAIPSIQPLLVFIYSLFLSVFFPGIIKEEINKYTILTKFLAVIFILTGSWLIVAM